MYHFVSAYIYLRIYCHYLYVVKNCQKRLDVEYFVFFQLLLS